MALIILAIIWLGYHLIKEASDTAWVKEESRKRGYDFYVGSGGIRDINTGKSSTKMLDDIWKDK